MATKPQDYSWTEPASDWNAIPPLNNVKQTESGHSFEMDDTPGAERIRLQHRTGTFTEIQANGQQIVKVLGDKYEIIVANNNVLISGVCNITVEGDSVMHVKGDAYAQIDGNSYQRVKKKTTIQSKDNLEISTDGDIDLFAGGSTSTINLTATEAVNIHSDVNVSGSLNSRQSISAVQNVSAGLKLGSLAGVDTTGPIVSSISVFAPMVSDIGNSMMGMRLVYDFHKHPTTRGPTGTPFTLM
jgi:hypothetical protein